MEARRPDQLHTLRLNSTRGIFRIEYRPRGGQKHDHACLVAISCEIRLDMTISYPRNDPEACPPLLLRDG